jgi:hypothetical protein
MLSGSIRTAPSGGPPASFGGRRRAIVPIAWAMTPFTHTAQCMDAIVAVVSHPWPGLGRQASDRRLSAVVLAGSRDGGQRR